MTVKGNVSIWQVEGKMAELVTNRDDKDHSTTLSRKLFTSRRQRGVANGNKLEARRGLPILGELYLVSQHITLTYAHMPAPMWCMNV